MDNPDINRNIVKNKFKKRIASLAVLLSFVLIAIYLAQKILPLVTVNNNTQQTSQDKNDSPFQNVGVNQKEQLLQDMKVFFVGGDQNYWKDWNYKQKVIFAHIQEINLINNDIVATINPPPYERFSQKKWSLHVTCPRDKSIAVSDKNPLDSVVNYNFNILDQAKIGDILIGYCLEEECINIGNKCYLVVRD